MLFDTAKQFHTAVQAFPGNRIQRTSRAGRSALFVAIAIALAVVIVSAVGVLMAAA